MGHVGRHSRPAAAAEPGPVDWGSMVDNYPVVSQVKSLVQASAGDLEGARQTQSNFLNETPVLGDVTYVFKLARGDREGARNTRRRVNRAWNGMANAVPVVGHIKGAVHYGLREKDEARQAFKSANRGSVIAAAGALAGPLAPAAALVAGISYDAVDSLLTGTSQGLISTIDKAVVDPTVGNVFDAMVAPPLFFAPTSNPIKVVSQM